MRRKLLIKIIIPVMAFITSCQPVEKAIEDTFSKQPQKLNREDEKAENLWHKLESAFLDESNKQVSPPDIIRDAEDKMGYEFPIELNAHFSQYLVKNNIQHYLSKEDILAIVKEFEENDLFVNSDKREKVMEELFNLIGSRDFYIYDAKLRLHHNAVYIYVVAPENPKYVDLYYYNLGNDTWYKIPQKLNEGIDPMERAVLFSEINFDSYKKIVDTGTETLKEMGDYDESKPVKSGPGISYISTHLDKDSLIFKAKVEGTREDYDLTFDANGNLIAKERS